MKIALLCDLHFGVRSDSQVFLSHQEKFFKEIFFPKIDEENISVVLNLGDTFDRRKFINYVTLEKTKQFFFNEIEKRNIDYHMILGNHDTYFKNTNDTNSISLLLNRYNNFHIYENDPVELKFGSLNILMVPWLCDANQETSLKILSESQAPFVMGHFSINGFEMMRGSVCDHGLDKNLFSRFESVYSGHFHHPSEYGNIKYLGSQYEMTWGDYGSRRGFYILDTETRTLEFVENTNKIFHKLIYDDVDMTIDDITALDVSVLANTYIKVVVKNKTNPYIFDLFMAVLNESGAADVKVIEDSLNLEASGFDDILDQTKDTKDILHDYIDSIDTSVVKEKIKKVIDDLYIEASNLR